MTLEFAMVVLVIVVSQICAVIVSSREGHHEQVLSMLDRVAAAGFGALAALAYVGA